MNISFSSRKKKKSRFIFMTAFIGTGNTKANLTSSDLLMRPFFHTRYVFHAN